MIDTHAHLADKRFNQDRKEVINRYLKENINTVICICCDFSELETFKGLLSGNDSIFGAIGVHPHEASKYDEKQLLDTLTINKLVALGEIGLDYHYNFSPPDIQKEVFRKQLSIANSRKLPVIIHSREAMSDTLDILKEEGVNSGLMHCFSGSEEDMKECLALGLYISIAGPVTFPKAEGLRSVAAAVPADRLLIETDCPYLAPQPVRGKRNEPSYVRYVLEKISGIKNIPRDELEKQISSNAETLFNIRHCK